MIIMKIIISIIVIIIIIIIRILLLLLLIIIMLPRIMTNPGTGPPAEACGAPARAASEAAGARFDYKIIVIT